MLVLIYIYRVLKTAHVQFQYGAPVDIYSLIVIFFELFSGENPFPGNLFQVYQAKISDIKPAVPSHLPPDLKELVLQSFSKEPKERPPIKDIQLALNKMLNRTQTEWTQSAMSSSNETNEQEEGKLACNKNSEEKENNPKGKTKQLYTSLQAAVPCVINKRFTVICP
jgi:serine/threonine protein kinase